MELFVPDKQGTSATRRLIDRKSLDEDLADRLRDAILRGDLKPGERLTELGLAETWQVSQGTVRAALKLLSAEGLVESRPRRGTFVTSITETALHEICSLRDALEGLAAQRAAARIDDAARKALMDVLDGMRQAAAKGDRKGMLDLDFRFHRTVVAISDHKRLADVHAALESQTRLFLTMTELLHQSLEEAVTVHATLAEAIMAGNESRAFDLAHDHSSRDGRELAAALFPAG